MEFRILGPLEVVSDGRVLGVGGVRQRKLLELLLLHANEAVTTERLVEELWGETPPLRATKALQMHVVGLRKLLGEGRLETHPRGYRLRVEPGELDVERVEALAEEARSSEPRAGADALRAALDLFRGEPLGEFAYEPFALAESSRLNELRLHLIEERVDADLALGRHAALVAEVEALLVENPLRERLRGQLMLALYRSGRQADALDVYRRGRILLVDRLGLEPAVELRELEAAILRQDSALDGPPPETRRPERPRRRRRGALLAAGGVLAAASVAALVALVTRSERATPVVAPDSLVHIDARTGRILDVTSVGREPLAVVTSPEYLWVLNAADATVSRIDRDQRRAQTVGGLDAPKSIAFGPDETLWVGSETAGYVVGLDAQTARFVARIAVPGAPPAFIAVRGNQLWASQPNVGDRPGSVSRVDLARGRVVARYPLGGYTTEIAADGEAAWVGVGDHDAFARLDDGRIVRQVAVGRMPSGAAIGFGSAWTASYPEGTVWRVSDASGKVESVITVGDGPWNLAVGRDAVWVTNRRSGSVSRIDPRTNTVVQTIELGYNPQGIVVEGDDVWVTVASSDIGI